MHAGVRPLRWNTNLTSAADIIGSFLHLHHCLNISDQNFIFISQDSGFAVFMRKGANNAFIRTSSDQQGGSLSSGIPGKPILELVSKLYRYFVQKILIILLTWEKCLARTMARARFFFASQSWRFLPVTVLPYIKKRSDSRLCRLWIYIFVKTQFQKEPFNKSRILGRHRGLYPIMDVSE